MSAGIADAVGLVRAVAAGDDAGFMAVLNGLSDLESRQMVARLAHLVIAARTVAPDMPVDAWLSRMLTEISTH